MNFFRHFTVKKTRLPLSAARLSCLLVEWFADMGVICEEGLWKTCASAPKNRVCHGQKEGSETLILLILSPKN